MVFGHNTSTIDEEFPTPTPVPPGKSVVKRVKIRNEGSVACYIRAALIFSEPIEAIEGLDTENWVKGEDDYYYYDQPAYQYGRDKHTWYSMDATNFVAYAVWEKY